MAEKAPPSNSSQSTELLPVPSPGVEKIESSVTSEGRPTSRLASFSNDIVLLLAILAMLSWPWIFFGVVYTKTKNHPNTALFATDAPKSGIQAGPFVANLYRNRRQTATFCITLLGTAVSLIISTLFSLSVRRISQEWTSERKVLKVFQVVLLAGFRRKSFPLGLQDLKKLTGRKRWSAVGAVCAYLGAMAVVTSGVSSLLTPVNVILQELVTASSNELDFAADAPECIQWISSTDLQVINGTCGYQDFQGLTYNVCLGQKQMLDALDAGQSQIFSLLRTTENTTFTKISDHIDLLFEGPIRGILPSGPNGVFSSSALKDANDTVVEVISKSGVLAYNYTLLQQGLFSNISCEYATESPIGFASTEASDIALLTTGNCSSVGASEIANTENLTVAPEVNAKDRLAYWACQSASKDAQNPSYLLYFRGYDNYSKTIGNVTCSVSPLQTAVFPLDFRSSTDAFSVQVGSPINATAFSSALFIDDLLFSLANIISSAQNFESNLLADIVVESGVKYGNLSGTTQDPDYLNILREMIQGVLEYEATYNRLIYSGAVPAAPAACTRSIEGSISYQVIGWKVSIKQVFFLIPMTLVNLASLAMMLFVLFSARGRADLNFDPTDPRQLIYAESNINHDTSDEFQDAVVYLPRGNLKFNP